MKESRKNILGICRICYLTFNVCYFLFFSFREFKIPLESEIDVPLQDNDESPNSSYGAKATSAKFGPGSFQDRRQSIFAHSSPSQFPDILKARKSAFGSIFVRASAIRGESLSGRRWLSSSQSVSPRGASSPEKVSGASSDSDKRLLLSLGLKDSVFRAFEKVSTKLQRSLVHDLASLLLLLF